MPSANGQCKFCPTESGFREDDILPPTKIVRCSVFKPFRQHFVLPPPLFVKVEALNGWFYYRYVSRQFKGSSAKEEPH